MTTPHDILKSSFGFDAFRAGQRETIDILLAGRSAAAIFPTGSGKSLCYQLTALMLPGLTLVVSTRLENGLDYFRVASKMVVDERQ